MRQAWAVEWEPHPEGGSYAPIWRSTLELPATGLPGVAGPRVAGSCIAYRLEPGERSRWHRVRSTELWLWQGGGPLVLSLSPDGARVERELVLGPEIGAGQALIGVVPKGWWQAARPAGGRWRSAAT